jgi:hypothetical protein
VDPSACSWRRKKSLGEEGKDVLWEKTERERRTRSVLADRTRPNKLLCIKILGPGSVNGDESPQGSSRICVYWWRVCVY